MASIGIPAIFPPVRIDGRYLVDGGLANNTPISTAVHAGAQRIIVLPTGFPCGLATPPATPIPMALHGLSLLIARQLVVDVERFAHTSTGHIVPPLCPLEIAPTAAFPHRAARSRMRPCKRPPLPYPSRSCVRLRLAWKA